jgi:hypothetical protein
MIILSDVQVSLTYRIDGSCVAATLEIVERKHLNKSIQPKHSYTRSMEPEEYGRWMHSLLSVWDPAMRYRMNDDGSGIELGHPSEDKWFDPRSADEIAGVSRQAAVHSAALRHINLHRASYGHRPLDPAVAGWSTDDVLKHARDLGWSA